MAIESRTVAQISDNLIAQLEAQFTRPFPCCR